MAKKIISIIVVLIAIIFFGYHCFHYGDVITKRDEAAMYQWQLNWADRK